MLYLRMRETSHFFETRFFTKIYFSGSKFALLLKIRETQKWYIAYVRNLFC